MSRFKIALWVTIFFSVLIWSGIEPYKYFLWFVEALPALIAFCVFVWIFPRFKFTELVYWSVLVHIVIVFIGAHYSYSHVPLFDTIKEIFNQNRNNYDKLAHIAQGFVPALVFRELFIRYNIVKKGKWIFILTTTSCLAFSALYEIIEWSTTIFMHSNSGNLIGMQGDIWDTHTDMLFALIGAFCSQILLKKAHDKQIKSVSRSSQNISVMVPQRLSGSEQAHAVYENE